MRACPTRAHRPHHALPMPCLMTSVLICLLFRGFLKPIDCELPTSTLSLCLSVRLPKLVHHSMALRFRNGRDRLLHLLGLLWSIGTHNVLVSPSFSMVQTTHPHTTHVVDAVLVSLSASRIAGTHSHRGSCLFTDQPPSGDLVHCSL